MKFIKTLTLLLLAAGRAVGQGTLNVCATIPDLGNLAAEIGGGNVSVTTFVKPTEDPHFGEAKPSFIKSLSVADLSILSGMELEVGYLPAIITNARNAKIQPGTNGYLDASTCDPAARGADGYCRPLDGRRPPGGQSSLPSRSAQRPQGRGADPRPARRRSGRVGEGLRGAITRRSDSGSATRWSAPSSRRSTTSRSSPCCTSTASSRPSSRVARTRTSSAAGSSRCSPSMASKAVGDHNLWPYFARRFGIEVVGFFEPLPGVPPTTKHLSELIGRDAVART